MDDQSQIQSRLNEPEFVSFISEKIQKLRERLIDGTRKNPLINTPFRANSRTLLRFVDELPDVLRYRLSDKQEGMLLDSLPALGTPLPDEQTEDFVKALTAARFTDEVYKADMDSIDATQSNAGDLEQQAERALKDRIRAELGLPVRQTEDNPSLPDHALAHGVRPEYELPLPEDEHADGRHSDQKIQTLLLPENLGRTGKALEDKGACI